MQNSIIFTLKCLNVSCTTIIALCLIFNNMYMYIHWFCISSILFIYICILCIYSTCKVQSSLSISSSTCRFFFFFSRVFFGVLHSSHQPLKLYRFFFFLLTSSLVLFCISFPFWNIVFVVFIKYNSIEIYSSQRNHWIVYRIDKIKFTFLFSITISGNIIIWI